MEENKSQIIRRTRTEMKTDVLNAVSQLSKEKQLSLITMVDVSKFQASVWIVDIEMEV